MPVPRGVRAYAEQDDAAAARDNTGGPPRGRAVNVRRDRPPVNPMIGSIVSIDA